MGGRARLTAGSLLMACTGVLVGCASDADLARPERRLFALGSASYADVVARFGPPQRTAEVFRNGARIQVVWYSHAGSPSEASRQGDVPIRVLECDFANGVLVGRVFASSFKSDSTDFDASLAPAIRKGATSSDEVEILVGRPSAFFVAPLVEAPAAAAVGYFAVPVDQGTGSGGWTFRKSLTISFDSKDLAYSVKVHAP